MYVAARCPYTRLVRVLIVMLVIAATTGCIGSSSTPSHGGFTGADAHWYDVQYEECAEAFKKAGTDPHYRLDVGWERSTPRGHWRAASAGCAAAADDAGGFFEEIYGTKP
jgi:hypothetical protein